MYPLDQGVWGPVARITRIRDELARLADLEVVAGYRGPRRRALWGYVMSRQLRGLDGIYVESSSGFPALMDLAFLALARLVGVPVLTYIRDAQYLFPSDYRPSLKRRVARWLFRPAMRLLRAVSSRAAYPSAGLAEVLGQSGETAFLLPPGSPPTVEAARDVDARSLLYVGSMKYPVTGYDILRDAVERLRGEGHVIDVICFCRPTDDPPGPWPSWMHVERGAWAEIVPRLPGVLATVQPRHRSTYSDLGIPIKIMEYLSYGRPIVATDCTETARIIEEADCGIVVRDTADSLAAGLRRLLDAPAQELDAWGENAWAAALRNGWGETAQRIVAALAEER
jgi:glycosyltransferase involved in cell wall biosynthesis